MSQTIYPVAVIGGGSAGTMAALRTVLNNDETLFFPGSAHDKKRSRALWVAKVENVPGHLGYKKGIEQPNRESLQWLSEGELKDKLHWKKNTGIESISKNDDGVFSLKDSKGETWLARYIIIATGVMDVQPEINGSIEDIFPYANAQTADYCLRCDGHHVLGKRTAVIGHQNGAAWVAVMLYERYRTPKMSVLTHNKKSEINGDVLELCKKYGIEIIEGEIVAVMGKENGKVLEGFQLADGTVHEFDWSFVSLGMIVYNELAKSLGCQLDERGFVIGDDKGMTSTDGVYVAGDLRANTKKQIYTAWDTAVDAADAINAKLRAASRIIS
ncbi:MAG: thioredoxin [Bdellovibrionales bacterium CG12_big_fil_rev_8_21_14_0_65_38_15]|nr:MAG: thioredoxin [Bdellovibrionales bacterium CG22_combo_CG10-13_8_21_14_all_38_13]PIQ55829.1 MAG: thioredoxin [Bdellovibrionales bacterium CG12_big_fil_rev_8_21_14_0_65_38_15]PIR28732.1 MAG: thioredoxin [Bdellovibrionales bacterium CG11_big_fil_rev_8_21_14_0_20_38_13]